MGSKNGSDNYTFNFSCIKCNFKCNKNSDYSRHLGTLKHKRCNNDSNNVIKKNTWICKCGKEYKYDSGYYRHKKTCNIEEKATTINTDQNEEINYKEMFIKMMNENEKLRSTITDLIPKIGNTTTTTTNNNNIHQKFNINVFLNEDCKDALTMEQFIDNIQVTMSNLLLTKTMGIDEGISNIFIENMSKLSINERPMHCTDTKRDTIYIKSDGENGDEIGWAKDTDREKIKKAIKKIESKQHKNLGLWMEEHPDWETNEKLQEEYLNLMRSCTKDVKEQKIIKNLCNTVKIDQ